MKNIIVTGGCGFIGSTLVDTLVSKNYNVRVIDNLSAESNPQFYKNPNAEYYEIGIEEKEKLQESGVFEEVDTLFHLAAESRIQPTLERPSQACFTNFYGTAVILELCKEYGVEKVMYSGTSSAYGLKNTNNIKKALGLEHDSSLKEDMPRDCLNPYSVSKTAAEDLCKMYYSLWGLKTVIFRYFNVYGERQPVKGQYAPVIGLFLRQRANNEPMTIVGDGLQTRDFTHVKDIVQANILAALSNNEQSYGEIFNVGTGRSHSVLDIAKYMGGEYIHIPARKGESRETLANIDKISEILGYEPSVKLEEWLDQNK
tara:strand:- start:32 stop:973 length:942 start_codon:yes stop_codon:yes gene_type:complete